MFTVTLLQESKKLNKKTILQRMSRINLKSKSPQEIKDILNTKYETSCELIFISGYFSLFRNKSNIRMKLKQKNHHHQK